MKLNQSGRLLSLLVALWITPAFSNTSVLPLIPQPVTVETATGQFVLTIHSEIIGSEAAMPVMRYLRRALAPATGYTLPISTAAKSGHPNILFKLNSELTGELGKEGYRLTVTPQSVQIEAAENNGLFYACQTLRQLLPAAIFQTHQVRDITWAIPCVRITDKPRFPWRGMHLDVARHFMPKAFVKKYIDLLALHKMNIFHWHLTEDQGWRIEIKKYPKLTDIGAWRTETVIGRNTDHYDGTPHGGFYTQDDVREIVAYAKAQFITVIPEIEMPGHSKAALAAYPEYSCTGGPFQVHTRWGIVEEVYCAGNDGTIRFLQDILEEVLALFPAEFIHIGGDECPKRRWKECPKCQARIKAEGLKDEYELQSWFIKQMDTFLAEKGRRLIGWDEILEGGLAPGATVMSWRGEEGGIAAANAGHDVVMAPYSHTYFDYYQADPNTEPLVGGGFTPLEKVYGYEPIPAKVALDKAGHILGTQGQVWTEYIPHSDFAEYMAFPRTCALAEVAWSPKEHNDFEAFKTRLAAHLKRLDVLNVNYRPLDKK